MQRWSKRQPKKSLICASIFLIDGSMAFRWLGFVMIQRDMYLFVFEDVEMYQMRTL